MARNKDLPQIGVEAVVLNEKGYVKSIGNISKKTKQASAGLTQQSNKSKILGKASEDLGARVNRFVDSLTNMIGVGDTTSKQLGAWAGELVTGLTPALAVAITGVVALGIAFIKLGLRSAEIDGIRRSFISLANHVGFTSESMLSSMRKAAAGTIADTELMRQANIALSGATQDVGFAFGKALPDLLAVARVQAGATGKSVEFLFESLVSGIKRSSPLLIDNTGLLLDIVAAETEYAVAIGITREQLTEEEKQIALITATVAAGNQAIEDAGGIYESSATKIGRMGASLQNTWDRLATAIQPAFDLIVGVADSVLQAVLSVVNGFIGIAGFIINIITGIIQGIMSAIGWIIQPLVDIVSRAKENLEGLVTLVRDNAERLAKGAGRMMSGLALGILQGLNQFVLPAVLLVAKTIADFLIGASPPPVGPLSTIDQGGANVMSAWAEGFLQGNLQPIEQVTAQVSQMMGDVATASIGQVENQLAQINRFLTPFENRIKLLDARYTKLNEAASGAIAAIDRQQAQLLKALSEGDEGARDRIRQLDAERAAIQFNMNQQTGALDQAKIQLALAQASVGPRKAALEIRKAQLAVETKLGTATARTSAIQAKKPGAPKPGAAGVAAKPGVAVDKDIFGVEEATEDLGPDLGAAFMEGLLSPEVSAALATAEGLSGDISAEFGRITPEGLGGRFTAMFAGLGETLQTGLLQPFQDVVDDVFAFFSGDPDSLNQRITDFVSGIGGVFLGIGDALRDSFVGEFILAANRIVVDVFGLDNALSIPGRISHFITNIGTFFSGIGQALEDSFVGNFLAAGQSIFTSLFDATDPLSLAARIMLLPSQIGLWLLTLPQLLLDNLVTPFLEKSGEVITALFSLDDPTTLGGAIWQFFSGDGPGSLRGLLNSGLLALASFPAAIGSALSQVGVFVWNAIAVPIINVINWVITKLNEFISRVNEALEPIEEFLLSIGVSSQLEVGTVGLVNTTVPGWITGAATGGLFGPGMMLVGEKGPELAQVGSASKMAVFPADFTGAVVDLTSVLVELISAPSPVRNAGGTQITDASNTTVNFNGMRSGDESRRAAMSLRLFTK